jgi:hypothetical protein
METAIPPKPKSALPLIARILRKEQAVKILSPLEKLTQSNLMVSDNAEIIKTDKLDQKLLTDLFENKILGLHIPGFCSKEIAEFTANNALKKEISNWNVRDVKNEYKQSDVDVFGTPYTMAVKDNKSWENYFSGAKKLSEELRGLSYPNQYPLDKFRLEMDEVWPEGMVTKTLQGAKMVPGLVRVMHEKIQKTADIPLNCHVDTMPILLKNKGQFSVNIYLKPAAAGGNLFIWNTKISGLKEFFSKWYVVKNFFMQSNYLDEEIQRNFQSMLPEPKEIRIEQGDLVLINTGRPHAISSFSGGPRVSLQAFITYEKGKPLKIWA